jgi:hypothetical protein
MLENHKSECLIGHKIAMETKLPGLGTCLPASGTGIPDGYLNLILILTLSDIQK